MVISDNRYRLNAILVFFLVILSLNFFYAKVVTTGALKNLCFAYILGAIMLSVPYFMRYRKGFVLPVQMISLSILCSIFVTSISWNQGFSSCVSTIPYMLWFVFFYLIHVRFPLATIEKIVCFYGWLYIVLYAFQFTHSSQVYFGFSEEFKEDRGVVRILFPGAGVFFLAYFISLNKVMAKVPYRWLHLLFILAGIAVTILQVTKQSIALLLLITLFHLLRNVSAVKKLAIMLGAGIIIFLTLNSDNPISKGIIDSQKDNVSDGSQNIRVMASEYFLSDFSPNLLSRIMGNGFPNLNSAYGKYITMLEDSYGYYLTDVGLVGLYAMFGVLPILAYIIIFIKGFRMSVPKEYKYLKYYLFYIVATCLTSDAIFSVSFLMTNVFVLYSLHVIYEQNNSAYQTYQITE